MLATLCIALGAAGLIPLQRDDLARSFLRFEAAYAAHPPSAADRVATERAFDALSMQFLAGNFADALAQLDTLTARLTEPETATTARRMAFDAVGLRLRGDVVTIGSLYLPELVEAIAQIAPIDRTRVYVVGHSLGGITTIELLKRHADHIAAACCIAGGTPTAATATKLPRTLVLVGANDPLMQGDAIEKNARRAIESGVPLTLRIEQDRGHTLMVGDSMDDVVDWLMKK